MKISINLVSLFVAILAFLLAAFSTWLQFRPVTDRVSLTGGERIWASNPIEIREVYNLDTKDMDFAVGPISWRFQVYNPTNKSISLTEFSATHITNESRYSAYSNLKFDVAHTSNPNEVLSGLETIRPNEAKSYTVAGFVVIQSNQMQRENCLKSKSDLYDLEGCFAEFGSDFFGRKLVKSSEQHGNRFVTTHSFVNYQARAQILLTLTLGDGSKDELALSY